MSEVLKGSEVTNTSIKVFKRTERTWQTWLLHALLRPFRNHVGRPGKQWPEGSPRCKIPSSSKRTCNIVERRVEDVWLYDMTLKDAPTKIPEKSTGKRPHRMYFWAGGGWQSPPGTSHWKFLAALLQELPHATVTIISYPLAPVSPAPVAFPHLLRLYDTLLKESASKGEVVTLVGDSSGGEIVLCLPLEALRLDINAPKPQSIMAICPSTDLSRQNPIIKRMEKHDPILKSKFINETASRWAGGWDLKDPRISPLHSNELDLFRKAGIKVDGCTAGYDILGPDGVLFRTKLAKNGVEGEWLQWEKMMHCWPIAKAYRISPESEEAFQWIADVLKRRSEEEPNEIGGESNGHLSNGHIAEEKI
jgi:acetyl esterase/lipase